MDVQNTLQLDEDALVMTKTQQRTSSARRRFQRQASCQLPDKASNMQIEDSASDSSELQSVSDAEWYNSASRTPLGCSKRPPKGALRNSRKAMQNACVIMEEYTSPPTSPDNYENAIAADGFTVERSGSLTGGDVPLLSGQRLTGDRSTSCSLLGALDRSDSEFLGDTTVFLTFPLWLEMMLQPLDDPLLSLCQQKTKGLVKKFSKFWTFVTALEAGLVWSIVLFAVGYRDTARLFTCMLFCLSICSQVPKRFVWRPRPWMVARAEGVRKDKTSSFPSRAAACSLVFPLLIINAYEQICGAHVQPWVTFLVISFCVTCTAFARINVGAHYPSDILAGLVMGALVWHSGLALTRSVSILDGMMRAVLPLELRFVVGTFASFVTNIVFMEHFWAKCSFVFGILLAGMTYDVTFHPSELGSSSASSVILAVISALAILAYGMFAHKRKGFAWQLVVFTQVFFVSLAYMLYFG